MSTSPYDQVPYLNGSHARTHPDRAATLATLLGLEPACLDHCRVLELGCANGRNCLPTALSLPGAQFVGLRLSAQQIADGQAAVLVLCDVYPRPIAFDDLAAAACARVYPEGDLAHSQVMLARDGETIGLNLPQGGMHDANRIDPHTRAPALASAPGDRPVALPSARCEARRSDSVTDDFYPPVRLGTLSGYLPPFLDGTRDLSPLVERVMLNQTLALEQAGQDLSGPEFTRPQRRARIAGSVDLLTKAALITQYRPDPKGLQDPEGLGVHHGPTRLR